jgi:hypothetical protein
LPGKTSPTPKQPIQLFGTRRIRFVFPDVETDSKSEFIAESGKKSENHKISAILAEFRLFWEAFHATNELSGGSNACLCPPRFLAGKGFFSVPTAATGGRIPSRG